MPDPALPAVRRPYLDAWPGFSTYDPMYPMSFPRFGYGDHVTPLWRMDIYRRAVAFGWCPDVASARDLDLATWRYVRVGRRQMDRARMLRTVGQRAERRYLFNRAALFSWPRRCAYCGTRATHADHVIPRRQGGTDDYGNLAPACARCNVQKSGRTPTEWRAWREARGQCWPPAGAIHTREAVAA